MNISLQNIGRRFNREWIFRGVDYTFEQGNSYAILGSNGSGKSTLLQVLNGSLAPSTGKLAFEDGGKNIEPENVFNYLSLAAPYLELIEEFSLSEMIDFHFKFKSYKPGVDRAAVADILNLQGSRNKAIRYFSSGMKQRLKLALAFCSDTKMLMLDEPTSNLDNQGIDWYLGLVEKYSAGRLTIICSNQEHEYAFCENRLSITDYKP
ncbi:ATP-binding cassette domain-containing protein [Mucilaginibacter pallidiroseus]|uniref:ATP-binding cassette domain-containing protein n=1 Tax=Mucilaginibacter pallidiroseus TaxID=2599295 RepID=A0A563UGW7_9SPHI|nr:ATP-binding cassette domain-containing protein [Mucilaginibacter pallidiroseus]TWR30581.1 ATP-binding cassette domain-containing protein [Mucilaginibacter pallidiroseus]